MTPEGKFKRKVLNALSESPFVGMIWVSETRRRRGHPDIMGLLTNGLFFALEVKTANPFKKNGEAKAGRARLQWASIKKIVRCGGVASFVFPENLEDTMVVLKAYAEKKVNLTLGENG